MVRREANLGGLIKKLEGLLKELGTENDEAEEETGGEFVRIKKRLGTQIIEIKKAIQNRADLQCSVGGGGKSKQGEIAQLSNNIRMLFRDAEVMHKQLSARLLQEEKDLSKPKKKMTITPEEVEEHRENVVLYRSHLDECIELDRKRFSRQTRAARKDGVKMQEITRHAEAFDSNPVEIDSTTSEGLAQLERNDQALDEKLDMINKGVQRLKGIAVDQSNEVRLQGAMLDKLEDHLDDAQGHLNEVNQRMKETLEKVGGATNIMVKVILLILILAICAYLYKAVA